MNWRLIASEALDKAGAVLLVGGVYLVFGSGFALIVAGTLLMIYAYAILQ